MHRDPAEPLPIDKNQRYLNIVNKSVYYPDIIRILILNNNGKGNKMATLTYWKAEMNGGYMADALRAKTKKELIRQIEESSDSSYEAPEKMVIVYKDAFDLMECVVFNNA